MKVIILAGGGGTRLYPLSTEERPKQFLNLFNDKSLLINTVERFLGLCSPRDIVIVTNDRYKNITVSELEKNNLSEVNILTEPARKNTAPAIVLAVRYCIEVLKAGENEVIIISPSDHMIKPLEAFHSSVLECCKAVRDGHIATLGVVPTKPETGYGYIEAESVNSAGKAKRFCEKPVKSKAEEYLKSGKFFWNAGIYGFSYKTFKAELAKTSQNLYKLLELNLKSILSAYESTEAISIDYAVSEKSDNIFVIPMKADWSDVGGWDALYEISPKDENGNVLIGNVKHENCHNCLLISDKELRVKDLKDITAVQNNAAAIVVSSKVK